MRRPTVEDLPQIEELAEKTDSLLVDKFITAAIVENEEELIAFAVSRGLFELVLYTDGSKRNKTLAVKKLVEQAKADARAKGYTQVFAFIQDEKFAEVLCSRKFGFRKALGTPVLLDLEPEDEQSKQPEESRCPN